MRGHWISTTRKLNKHYQNGDDLEVVYTCRCPAPYRLSYRASGYNPYDQGGFYNHIETPYDSTINNCNLARANVSIGPKMRGLDGAFIPGPDYAGTTRANTGISTQALAVLRDQVQKKQRCKPITGSNTEYFVPDWNMRYIRYHVPKYSFGPGYLYGPISTLGRQLGKCEIGVYNGISLSALACKAVAYRGSGGSATSASQRVVITQEYSRSGYSSLQKRNITYMDGSSYNNVNFNIYDQLETQGKTYLDLGTTIQIYDQNVYGTLINVKVKIFVFFHNGDLYIDQVPHLFDPDTDEEITWANVYLTTMAFPNQPAGFSDRQTGYVQPDEGYPIYPRWMQSQWNTSLGTGVASDLWMEEIGNVLPLNGVYGEDSTYVYNFQPNLRVYKMKEEDFWEAQHAAADRIGDVHYDPPEPEEEEESEEGA